ncbi:unnamed protein product [Notodromas monacha]|uniref:Protein inhibitor of activated STAT n=1 Tax=Notodromas monacha TaxID=399045 RepID=A0A7R9BQF8_9CRUS|nr:unnamed protein product [Notodromas monacha]CAG0918425.1 unnamed protein product [Notodromas monacha]
MMTPTDAKVMINNFRVSELQMFLAFVGLNKIGRKEDLLTRAFQVVDGRNFNDRIKSKIRELHDSVCANNIANMNISNGIPLRGIAPNLGGPRAQTFYSAALQTRQQEMGIAAQHQMAVQDKPQKMIGLPFFEVLESVHPPTFLQANNPAVKIQESKYQVTLKAETINRITEVRDIRPGVLVDYPVQLLLRFSQKTQVDPAPDAFPTHFNVKFNGKAVQLPQPVPAHRQGMEPKRPPKPVNITSNARLAPLVPNLLEISWGLELGKKYAFQIELVRKIMPDELLNVVKKRSVISKDLTKQRIREILVADNDIAPESLRLSLKCPLGQSRVSLPCRAFPSCRSHVQCFDAQLFLSMNERKSSWVCPVCNKPIQFSELALDEYFSEMLASNLTADCDEVILNSDGTFVPVPREEKEKKGPSTSKQEANGDADLVLLSDEENEDQNTKQILAPRPAAVQLPPASPPPHPAEPEIVTIDIDD